MEDRAAREAVNRCRLRDNETGVPDPKQPQKEIVIGHLKPGDKGYLPPAEEFITIEFHNGSVTVEAEFFGKLPKRKQSRLMKY